MIRLLHDSDYNCVEVIQASEGLRKAVRVLAVHLQETIMRFDQLDMLLDENSGEVKRKASNFHFAIDDPGNKSSGHHTMLMSTCEKY